MKDLIKEFKASSWSIDNKTSIYVLTFIICVAGYLVYEGLPKEQFPEVVFPQILVNTIYPGTSPTDMENLVTNQIEKRVKAIPGVKKVTSNSVQDFSMVNVEFGTDVNVEKAKQKVKDEVDKAASDLPKDLPAAPQVIDIDISQMPIMNVHVSGDFELDRLKNYADILKDKIEGMPEIRRVDIVGALEREIKVDVDMYKMAAASITMMDIENAVKYENMTISGGQISMDNVKRSVNIVGEFTEPRQIGEIIIRSGSGAIVHLKDIAEIKDGYKEQESYARLEHKNVISLNVIKRGGANLINASDKIHTLTEEMKKTSFPKGLIVKITGDQSTMTRVTLHDLINTIIIGFILVTLILMFFMGATNAIFVAMSVPISMAIAFLFMPTLGFTLNMMVLFAFLLALGIVVDDAIVVIENTHRIFHENHGKMSIVQAAKLACGEVFLPVLSGTATTLAPFVPLAFWQGTIGKFMFYLPITMIVTLSASLVVAYIINPVFAVDFMKKEEGVNRRIDKGFLLTTLLFIMTAIVAYAKYDSKLVCNLAIVLYIFYALHKFVFAGIIIAFQEKAWPKVKNTYANLLTFLLKGWRPYGLLASVVALLVGSFVLVGLFPPKVVFFPASDPNFIYTYINLPVGTGQKFTDSITNIIENRVYKVLGENNPLVESVISNVAVGAGDPQSFDMSNTPNKGKVSVAFVSFEHRHGKSTTPYLNEIRNAVKGIPGVEITVEQEANGPPTGKPISIEIGGEDFKQLIKTSNSLKRYLDSLQIKGVEELKSDLVATKPEVTIRVNRERANREGISTAQIGGELRNAIFGKEISKLRENNDEYPIQMRLKEDQRNNLNVLLNHTLTFRDMNMGGALRSIPIAAVADLQYGNTYGGIKRKNQKRLVTLSSNILTGYNPNQVVSEVQAAVDKYNAGEQTTIKFGGEQEQQQETMSFLGWAMMASLLIIVLILVTQFNSIGKPLIILSEIIFSITGVLLGFVFFRMDMSIVMCGIGIIALAGIVVRNGILLVEFIDILRAQGMELNEALIEAGRTRMTPVLLTATATILGLIPLAIGLNMDFVTLLEDFNPHIFFGGDSVAFWGPLAWTMIFGLVFATFLTLLLVPVMYMIGWKMKHSAGKIIAKLK